MCISLGRHRATENHPVKWCLENYPQKKSHISKILARINTTISVKKNSKILELGCAQGLFIFALRELGYKCSFGVEPSKIALRNMELIEKIKHEKLNIKHGYAEKIPFEDETFDLVIAESVLEHVLEEVKVFQEVYRVLKKNGVFYFSTTSILCPYQGEIRFFPFFSWYPDKLKKKIMNWSSLHHPDLIGNTQTPAINWYSFKKVKKLAKTYGFRIVKSRWDMVGESTSPKSVKVFVKNFLSLNSIFRFIGDILTPGSTYLLIK